MKTIKNFIKDLIKESLFESGFNPQLLKKMGYTYVGKNDRIGSEAFIHSKDDNDKSYHSKLQKLINKNLNKGRYYRSSKKDSLKDPPVVGISLPDNMKG